MYWIRYSYSGHYSSVEYENLSEVFLVGHNYGGLVIGGAADKVSQRIRCLS
jgi:hypothetical protein